MPAKQFKARTGIDTGVSYIIYGIPGNIPVFEEHDARIKAGYTLTEWYKLDSGARALEVAHYRLRNIIDLAGNDAMAEAVKRKNKKRGI